MQQAQNPRRVALTALAIFAVAFVIRLIHVREISAAPFFTLLMGDSRAYDEWARRIAGGEWLGHEVFYQAPLYPYFLGVVYKTIGRDLFTIRVVQIAIGAASCALLFLAGARQFSYRVGVAAGAILALWAPAIFFDALIQKSVLDVFLVCVILFLLPPAKEKTAEFAEQTTTRPALRARRSPRFFPWEWLSVGLALGALALTRENALVFIVVIAVFALLMPGRITNAAWLTAGVVIVLLPVALRNASMPNGGFFVTTSQFGPNFYIGNHAGADGTYSSLRYGRGAPEYERQDATELAERAVGRALTPAEVSAYWTDRALTFITSQPAEWAALVGRKFQLLWNATEMVDTESQETYAEWSRLLTVLGPITTFGVLAPLALVGMLVTWRQGVAVQLLIALTAAYSASVLLFYVFARYRYPLVPLLILFAAIGLFELPAAWKNRRLKAFVALAAAVVFCNWSVVPRDWLRAVSETNLAAALQAEGRVNEAVGHYDKALALRPDYPPALNNKGTALRAAGRIDAAVAAYERAIAARGDYPEAHYNLANALTDAGRSAEATQHFERALESLPESADVHNNLGIALAAQGKADEAIAQFREAVRTDPKSAKAHRNLGDALLARGVAGEGLDAMREAARLAPDDGSLQYDLGSALLEAGRADEAAPVLQEAVKRLPQSAEARNNLGIAFGSLGRLDEAIQQFQSALAIKPDFLDARRNLEMALAARARPARREQD